MGQRSLGIAPPTGPTLIKNNAARYTRAGEWMDAHDGNIARFSPDGPFYMYAMGYTNCTEPAGLNGCADASLGNCGFRLDHTISVFTSDTLGMGDWTYVGDALPVDARPSGIYYRPKVVYNPNTRLFVLFVNWLLNGDFSQSQYLVATSPHPVGPFTVRVERMPTRFAIGGDFAVLVDDVPLALDSGEEYIPAYFMYTSLANGHNISTELLAPDFLSSQATHNASLSSGFFGQTFVEAPTLFKRKGWYYAMFGQCCCFCGQGSNIGVYAAAHPLGPWMHVSEVGTAANGTFITRAQANFVLLVTATSPSEGAHSDAPAFIWIGDNWQSAPDGVKAHDYQYWTPLQWNESSTPPRVKALEWVDQFYVTP